MKVGLLTAVPEEMAAVRRGWPLQSYGSLGRRPLFLAPGTVALCSGLGAERMRAAVELLERAFRPDFFVLAGFAVGLRQGLAVGEVVVDERSDPQLLNEFGGSGLSLHFSRIADAPLLSTSGAKEAFAQRHPASLAADMETEAFLTTVGGAPCLVVRAISDDLLTDLPCDFEECLTSEGFPAPWLLARKVLREPSLGFKLASLGRAAYRAGNSLTTVMEFVRLALAERFHRGTQQA